MKTGKAVIKGLSWRLFAAVDTMLVASVVMFYKTGELSAGVFTAALGIVGAELFTKTALFVVHEKLWAIKRLGVNA